MGAASYLYKGRIALNATARCDKTDRVVSLPHLLAGPSNAFLASWQAAFVAIVTPISRGLLLYYSYPNLLR